MRRDGGHVSRHGTDRVFQTVPGAVFDVGIAEGHAVTMCAGMAKQGMVPVFAVYSTFLQPTDDEIVYPYLTYDNVLVWKGLTVLAGLLDREDLAQRAAQVKKSIWDNCVMEQNGNRYFAWSIDLDGRHDVYDEPPGSLQLLPYWGFCAAEDQVYRNTVDMIRSPEYRYSFAGKPSGRSAVHTPPIPGCSASPTAFCADGWSIPQTF